MIYRHDSNTTFVDGFEAEDYGDFLIIHLKTEQITPDIMTQLAEGFQHLKKQIILVPKEWDVDFYGVEKEADSAAEVQSSS